MEDWETLLVAAGGTAAVGFGGYLLYDYAKSKGILKPSSGSKYCIPSAMSGEQLASQLGVSLSALEASNPSFTYMKAHPTVALKSGTCFVVPSGGKIPSVGGGSSK